MAGADPDADPCGYRTVFACSSWRRIITAGQVHARFAAEEGSSSTSDRRRSTWCALTETGVIDYMFQYKSVAIQHGFKYLELPDEINLFIAGDEGSLQRSQLHDSRVGPRVNGRR
ncbi:MAG: hypothetical protein MZV63_32455 [Marinilabiliales bacterium]|nr:hypothetical protein [Marinilabiliales bacterium]